MRKGEPGVPPWALPLGLAILGLVLALPPLLYLRAQERASLEAEAATARQALDSIRAQLERQAEVDAGLRAELDRPHPFDQPLVILDPYGVAPLSALIILQTEEACRMSLWVLGRNSGLDEAFAFEGYRKLHLLPLYGLGAGRENHVLLRAEGADGRVREKALSLVTGPLPASLSGIRVEILPSGAGTPEPGLTFLYESRPKFAFDASGEIRWLLDLPTIIPTDYFYRGRILVAAGNKGAGEAWICEVDPLGRFYSVSSVPYGSHHAFRQLGQGHVLALGSQAGPTLDDLLYELDPASGRIVASLDLRKVLDPSRPSSWRTDRDWLHMNGVDWLPSQGSIVVSGRNQSVLAKLSWPEGRLQWILGDHGGWQADKLRYLLRPQGQGFEWPITQHSPTILPDQDGDPETLDLLVFDNHAYGEGKTRRATSPDRYSRLVQYRIDEKAMTVSQVWEFGRDYGKDLFANVKGLVEVLPGGNLLSLFSLSDGHRTGYSRIIELSAKSRKPVWDAIVYDADHKAVQDYHAARRPLYAKADSDFWKLEAPILNLAKSGLVR